MTARPRIGQVNLVVADMAASLAFYELLGLEVPSEPNPTHNEIPVGPGVMLELDTADAVGLWDLGWSGQTGGAGLLGLLVDSRAAVDERYAAALGAGQAHQAPYDAFWGARYAIVDDPDGYPVGLMSPIDAERATWPPVPPPATT